MPDGSLVADFWMNGLFVIDENTLSRMDPRTFHVLWRTPIVSIGPGIAAGGKLWVEAPDRQGDRVLTVDPRNGHVIDSVHVGEFGARWMASRRLRGLDDHSRGPRGHPGELAAHASC